MIVWIASIPVQMMTLLLNTSTGDILLTVTQELQLTHVAKRSNVKNIHKQIPDSLSELNYSIVSVF